METTDSRDLRPVGIAGWAAFVLLFVGELSTRMIRRS
jgi:hypothetical protein